MTQDKHNVHPQILRFCCRKDVFILKFDIKSLCDCHFFGVIRVSRNSLVEYTRPLKHIRSKTSNNSKRCKRRSPPIPQRLLCLWESYGKSDITAKLNKVNQLTRLGLTCLLRAVCTYRPLLFFTAPKTEVY